MEINHPKHYNQYPVEVIDMMIRIFGEEQTRTFCILNAFKYRMRIGHKDDTQSDLAKEQWYLDKAKELSNRIADLMKKSNRDINPDIVSQSRVLENNKPSTVPGDIKTIAETEIEY